MMESEWMRTTTSVSRMQFAMTGMYRSTREVCLVERRGDQKLHADVANRDDDVVANSAVLADLQLADEHLGDREE